jgi:phosphate-selective porin OprO and OprP
VRVRRRILGGQRGAAAPLSGFKHKQQREIDRVRGTTRTAVLAAAAMGFVQPVLADYAETNGGLTVKSDDGRFEMKIGGRIHFDAYAVDNDDAALFGSGLTGTTALAVAEQIPAQGGLAFRRTYLTITGKAYGWKYKFENDFAAGGSPGSFRDMWVSAPVHADGELLIGQFKPRRGLEEITSSNEITMAERPWTTATGLFSGRQFLMGLGYKGSFADQVMVEATAQTLGSSGTTANEGTSYGSRVAWFPLVEDGRVVHVGVSYSVDHEQSAANASAASIGATAVAPYAGRRGPTLNFGAVGAAAGAPDSSQSTIGLEALLGLGPVALQGEYATADLENTHLDAGGARADSTVNAMYLQVGWFVTGEQVTYKKDRAAMGKPKAPLGEHGAWELTARYEIAENEDESALANVCAISGGLRVGGGAAVTPATTTKCEATTLTTGVNWYVNPNARFMLNYYLGEADLGGPAGSDKPKAITLRTQFAF